jgi:hypothetical protein
MMKYTKLEYIMGMELIKRTLSLLYLSALQEFITELTGTNTGNKGNVVISFQTNMNKAIKAIKSDTTTEYERFKKYFDNAEYIEKVTKKLDILYRILFPNRYKYNIKNDEIFLSIMVHVGRHLWECSYLFMFNGLSTYKKLENKHKISTLIKKGIQDGIDTVLMKAFLHIDDKERMDSIRTITIDGMNDKKIKVSEERLLEFLKEVSSQEQEEIDDNDEDTDDTFNGEKKLEEEPIEEESGGASVKVPTEVVRVLNKKKDIDPIMRRLHGNMSGNTK